MFYLFRQALNRIVSYCNDLLIHVLFMDDIVFELQCVITQMTCGL